MSDEYDLEAGPDPATFAAAVPEPEIDGSVVDPVYAVGVGPGNLEYLTPRGERAIREADVVVGFTTVVEFVEGRTDAELLTCGYRDEAATLETFAERVAAGESGTAVAMGDPNHSGYQFVGKVQQAVEREAAGTPVQVIPGISAIQVAASRARTPMEETEFVTLHKSGDLTAEMERLAMTAGDRHVLVLPRPYDRMPGDIAAFLRETGVSPELEALVLERLTHDDERIYRFELDELAEHAGGDEKTDTPFSDLVVLAIRRRDESS
ncbi:cobalt-precorrin-7 (C(5))-methyltransferase [Natronobacterium gregoryi]|uniref:Cobalt-precorrin-6Y C(5)-methyltransferase n=2 Tax=Natronobacterium gregoryi TaxID=44930 RepID=L0ABV7_NATGS|nr:cobalt-precorrin-7 (C(5))-methyltransferase [Natronobacterium gregoryi]AFZ71383.1 precorrin-6y C5,15-methyltransferase (decarboxylating), CbiE subunit [Natronobacterium gregoryi SP2]ELY66908.1 cobalt-precorrin-6Y C(5)-methyltransferase [Natronobacterium gregoryi SP2]PLK21237.1 cobalt-precorrin-7 (C(5))-methyltransferase [Natronobacterium gregoryi SP2]SFI84977.1 precorrin-6Y C5,15-methyltransferase (decarboxylating) [Natronobacterium gregoryi]